MTDGHMEVELRWTDLSAEQVEELIPGAERVRPDRFTALSLEGQCILIVRLGVDAWALPIELVPVQVLDEGGSDAVLDYAIAAAEARDPALGFDVATCRVDERGRIEARPGAAS